MLKSQIQITQLKPCEIQLFNGIEKSKSFKLRVKSEEIRTPLKLDIPFN